MSPAPNVINKRANLKLSRKDQLRRNPIPWIVVLIICGGLIYFLLPDFSSWSEKKGEIKVLEPANKVLQTEKEKLQDKKSIVEAEFNEKAGDFLLREKQIFPEKINPSNIAQIIEIYSILLEKNNQNAELELKSISIGKPTIVPGRSYAETQVNISYMADEDTFKKFMKFIQTGEVNDELRNRVVNRTNKGDAASIEFLDNNKLPVSNIRSLNVSENKTDIRGAQKSFNIQLQMLLFSQSNA